jgi:hypothetical protein
MLEPHLAGKKKHKKNQNLNTLNPQPLQSFPMRGYTEKTGGLLCCQTPAPNLLGRHRPSIMLYSHSHPWDKQLIPLDRLILPPCKKKKKKNLNNKQGTEKEHTAEGMGCCKHTREGRRSKELISMQTFSKQILERQKG